MTKARMTTNKLTGGMVRDTKFFDPSEAKSMNELLHGVMILSCDRRNRLLPQLCDPYTPLIFLS